MNEQIFNQVLKEKNIDLSDQQLAQFSTYYDLLVDWNEKVNLTAITEKDEVYLKHFYDSVTPSFFEDFSKVTSICDVGAGAGFPSLPLKICYPHLHITIIDSLKKRINFLQELIDQLQLTNVTLVHSRAEDAGSDKKYREKYDVVTARAVARMSVLSEYCLPFSKKGGLFIALKGANAREELDNADKAIKVLGGKILKEETFYLPKEESERSLIWIEKIKNTPKKYPRKAGTPNRKPIS
ncbi:MAG TPA: 16S rRNA (guanine(527)-N(7))-methyltransferase RsmG [Pseudogracilibacillus sp.]|nr:16S rRNA (guanine(527)-N(7))-methyltransferase RsmG [Pseudogracilibacillus sp.]